MRPALIVDPTSVIVATAGQPVTPDVRGATLYTGSDGHLYALLGASAGSAVPIKIA